VRGLLSLYDLGGSHAARIEQMTPAARKRTWLQDYRVRGWGYVALEAEASLLRTFEPAYVPGLLQTEGYVRALLAGSIQQRTAEQAEDFVALRRFRQRRLTSDDEPLDIVAIVDEGALMRQVGGQDVMRDQLEHLLIAAELDTVTLQVLPFLAGKHPGVDGSFSILSYSAPGDPDLVYVECQFNRLELTKESEIERASVRFECLQTMALSPPDTVALIEEVLDRT
jgi:hypothetical protein